MAIPPPPYDGISGIFVQIDKHDDVTKAQFDGNARPGQIIVDTSDYSIWIGNADGILNTVATGATGTSGWSGYSGKSGFSGYSGSGVSGFSGYSGSGVSGFSGYSGEVGISGWSGYSGAVGISGFSGYSGVPAGTDTYVQFNNSSSFGGDAQFTYTVGSDLLTVANANITTNLTFATLAMTDANINSPVAASIGNVATTHKLAIMIGATPYWISLTDNN